MPRLSVWCLGAASAAATTYTMYHYVYYPFLYEKPMIAIHQQRDMQAWQSIMQQAAILRRLVQPDQVVHESLSHSSQSSLTSPLNISTAWYTNAEMISFFCRLQRLRKAIYDSKRSTRFSAKQVDALLTELDYWEQRYCQPLHFREARLSMTQWALCVVCFTVYGIFFRLLPSIWTSDSHIKRQCLHRVARGITAALDIDCELIMSKTNNEREDEEGVTQGVECTREQYLVFAPQHWIELVGLWACPNSPLVYNITGSNVQEGSRSTTKYMLLSPREGSVCAGSYTDYWSKRQKQRSEDGVTINDTKTYSSEGDNDTMRDESAELYGYPLAVHLTKGNVPCNTTTSITKSAYMPVACVGLPRLLDLGPALAHSDVKPQLTTQEKYDAFFRTHYPLYYTQPANSPDTDNPSSNDTTGPSRTGQQQEQQETDNARRRLQQLRRATNSNTTSLSSVLSYLSVACRAYGGTASVVSTKQQSCRRCRLTYYVGTPYDPHGLMRGMLEATERAVDASLA